MDVHNDHRQISVWDRGSVQAVAQTLRRDESRRVERLKQQAREKKNLQEQQQQLPSKKGQQLSSEKEIGESESPAKKGFRSGSRDDSVTDIETSSPGGFTAWLWNGFCGIQGTMPQLMLWAKNYPFLEFVFAILRSVGLWQGVSNPVTGLLMLIGMSLDPSGLLHWTVIYGMAVMIIACYILQVPTDCINTGLFPVQGYMVISMLFVTREGEETISPDRSLGKIFLAFIPLAFTVLLVFQTLCEVLVKRLHVIPVGWAALIVLMGWNGVQYYSPYFPAGSVSDFNRANVLQDYVRLGDVLEGLELESGGTSGRLLSSTSLSSEKLKFGDESIASDDRRLRTGSTVSQTEDGDADIADYAATAVSADSAIAGPTRSLSNTNNPLQIIPLTSDSSLNIRNEKLPAYDSDQADQPSVHAKVASDFFLQVARGVAALIFSSNPWSALPQTIGVAMASPILAVTTWTGATLAVGFQHLMGVYSAEINGSVAADESEIAVRSTATPPNTSSSIEEIPLHKRHVFFGKEAKLQLYTLVPVNGLVCFFFLNGLMFMPNWTAFLVGATAVFFATLICFFLAMVMTSTGWAFGTVPAHIAMVLFYLINGPGAPKDSGAEEEPPSYAGLVRVPLEDMTVPEDHLRRYRLSEQVVKTLKIFTGKLGSKLRKTFAGKSNTRLSPGQMQEVEQTLLPILLCSYCCRAGSEAETGSSTASSVGQPRGYTGECQMGDVSIVLDESYKITTEKDESHKITTKQTTASSKLAQNKTTTATSYPVQQLKRLLSLKADVNTGDYDGRRPLHIAASDGNLKALTLLLQHPKVDVNVRDHFRNTPLSDALTYGHLDVARKIFSAGGGIALPEEDVASKLCFLIYFGKAKDGGNEAQGDSSNGGDSNDSESDNANDAALKISQLRAWLECGADANVADYDLRTPLHIAYAQRNNAAVDLLLTFGASENAVDRWGQKPKEGRGPKRGNDGNSANGNAKSKSDANAIGAAAEGNVSTESTEEKEAVANVGAAMQNHKKRSRAAHFAQQERLGKAVGGLRFGNHKLLETVVEQLLDSLESSRNTQDHCDVDNTHGVGVGNTLDIADGPIQSQRTSCCNTSGIRSFSAALYLVLLHVLGFFLGKRWKQQKVAKLPAIMRRPTSADSVVRGKVVGRTGTRGTRAEIEVVDGSPVTTINRNSLVDHDGDSTTETSTTSHGATSHEASLAQNLLPSLVCSVVYFNQLHLLQKICSQANQNGSGEPSNTANNLNHGDYDGRTGLHIAAACGHLEAVRILIWNGADVNRRDRFGFTPLYEASKSKSGNNQDVCEFLRSHGAKLLLDPEQEATILCWSASNSDVGNIDRYRRNGINMEARDYDGRSCRDIARDDGNQVLMRFLGGA